MSRTTSGVDLYLALTNIASSYVGVVESGGDNKGKMVEEFQKAFDGIAQGEPWCAAFVCFCLKQITEQYGVTSSLKTTELCTAFWDLNPRNQCDAPRPGYLAVFKKIGTPSGHIGIVTSVGSPAEFATIEGNTSDGSGMDRNGDGVYIKHRRGNAWPGFKLLGFLDPFR